LADFLKPGTVFVPPYYAKIHESFGKMITRDPASKKGNIAILLAVARLRVAND